MVHLFSQCAIQDYNKGDVIETSTNFIEVIDPNQTTFLPFHYIFDNILLA
jgi:hypothetical protein